MNRREFIVTAGIGAAALAGGKVFGMPNIRLTRDKRPPNILFILTDQQRFDAVGAYGNSHMHTPNIDRLAAGGVRFENSYVAQAVCSPSRASIFSGLYPHAHKVDHNIYELDDVISSPKYNMRLPWPLLMQRAGYRTGYIGKWHLGEKAPACFDEWHGFNSLLSHWMGEPHKSQYRSDMETDLGLDFLRRNRNQPFVLCQSYYPPHTPYTAPKEYWKHYEGSPLVEDRPLEYYAACSNIDANIGRLLKRLDDLDLMENTLIIFTSDHGEHFGRRPGGANKRTAHDESARVPLIIHQPGVFSGGTVCRELVSNVDLMPTILDAAGITVPERLHGRSLKPLVAGIASFWRTAVCIQNKETTSGVGDGNTCNSRGVRTAARKLIMRDRLSDRTRTLRELYDSVADPDERTDIYGPNETGNISGILDWLENWAKSTYDSNGRKLVEACRADLAGLES